MNSFPTSQQHNLSRSPVSSFCQSLLRHWEDELRRWEFPVDVFNIFLWFLFYDITIIITLAGCHNKPKWPVRMPVRVVQGQKRLRLFKLDENLVAFLAEGSSHSCHNVGKQVNSWLGYISLPKWRALLWSYKSPPFIQLWIYKKSTGYINSVIA